MFSFAVPCIKFSFNLTPSFPRDGDRLNRGGNTVIQETASHRAALSSLPKSSKAEFYAKK
jgi:hypothetical protein